MKSRTQQPNKPEQSVSMTTKFVVRLFEVMVAILIPILFLEVFPSGINNEETSFISYVLILLGTLCMFMYGPIEWAIFTLCAIYWPLVVTGIPSGQVANIYSLLSIEFYKNPMVIEYATMTALYSASLGMLALLLRYLTYRKIF
jgi:hypothetical protein